MTTEEFCEQQEPHGLRTSRSRPVGADWPLRCPPSWWFMRQVADPEGEVNILRVLYLHFQTDGPSRT